MKKLIAITIILVCCTVFFACQKNNNSSPKGTVYLDLPANTAVYYSNFNTYDAKINDKATLGRVLFYDSHLSVNNSIACASCHKQALGFADNVALSTGFEGRLTKRNSIAILNIANINMFSNITENIISSGSPLFWDGRENILVNLIDRPITNHVEMGMDNPDSIPSKLSVLSIYKQLFIKAYGEETITSKKISECIALFIASINSSNSKFDNYQKGLETLNAIESYGQLLFNSTYNCGNCHHPGNPNAYLVSNNFTDIGLDKNYTDLGKGGISGNASDLGKFRVPNLSNVALTAPYMHDGRYKTLDEVLDHYDHTILNSPNLDSILKNGNQPKKMNIPYADKQAIIAFLNTLTDYTTLIDPKFSNPFKVK